MSLKATRAIVKDATRAAHAARNRAGVEAARIAMGEIVAVESVLEDAAKAFAVWAAGDSNGAGPTKALALMESITRESGDAP